MAVELAQSFQADGIWRARAMADIMPIALFTVS
jgi:hypothetical protein